MRFGVREICDATFKALASVDIGDQHFDAGQPVLTIDTAKTSSLESQVNTVYAQGGKGNPRLIGWDGEKTMTFTIEDALMSPMSFAVLSGAGVVKASDTKPILVHQTYDLIIEGTEGEPYVILDPALRGKDELYISGDTPVFGTVLDSVGAAVAYVPFVPVNKITYGTSVEKATTPIANVSEVPTAFDKAGKNYIKFTLKNGAGNAALVEDKYIGSVLRLDCYVKRTTTGQEMLIEPGTFAGYYYIEASTLFRDEATGQDFPAEFIIPRGKIQSNFTFTMSNSGDPSTFTFTVDAFPGYTKSNRTTKVLAALQILKPEEGEGHDYTEGIKGHENRTSDADVKTGSEFQAAAAAASVKTPAQTSGK